MSENPETLSVSQALKVAKASLQKISMTVLGEVSEVSDKPGYKAVYFTLADEQSALPCLIWKNNLAQTQFAIRQGMLVEAAGAFSLYAPKGRLNFEVRTLRLAGEGALRLKVAELAVRLEALGLMDPARKLPIPIAPLRIGLVTSPRGKAVHDVLRTLRRRFPLAQIVLAGVPVEGAHAVEALIDGLHATAQAGVEVTLLVRGGGSYEDLMPFNDEALARVIATSPVPIVTGIGHEPDTTIADMVASARASTPTAAAERVSPDGTELLLHLDSQARRMRHGKRTRLARWAAHLANFETRPVLTDPKHPLLRRELALEMAQMRLTTALDDRLGRSSSFLGGGEARMKALGRGLIADRANVLGILTAKLESLSPLAVLARGYAVACDEDGHIVSSVDAVDWGARIDLRLRDGLLACRVEGRTTDEETRGE
ncbi:MAG: exodeoxyribonuclease VII large subunit [Coriobacteriales bacterium]|nr:exodeoxyribonuclease VII large subunit [Coriobacteriales bacterium]